MMAWLKSGALCAACVFLLSGCGGDGRPRLVHTEGTVLLSGQPLEGATVAFQPIVEDEKAKYQRPSSGITDASGKFQLKTYEPGDGAPVGKYRVAIVKREVVGKLPDDFNSEMSESVNLTYKWITPREVSDPASSGLTAEITSSGLEPKTFELTAAATPEIEKTGPQRRANEP
ncbi:hypothetical protein GC163_15505 [bacterium]|nr:hypothetical protein [bacterium]